MAQQNLKTKPPKTCQQVKRDLRNISSSFYCDIVSCYQYTRNHKHSNSIYTLFLQHHRCHSGIDINPSGGMVCYSKKFEICINHFYIYSYSQGALELIHEKILASVQQKIKSPSD